MEEIGIKAIFDTKDFEDGLKTYNRGIEKAADETDKLTDATRDLQSSGDKAADAIGDAGDTVKDYGDNVGDAADTTGQLVEATADASDSAGDLASSAGDAADSTETLAGATGDASDSADQLAGSTADAADSTAQLADTSDDAATSVDSLAGAQDGLATATEQVSKTQQEQVGVMQQVGGGVNLAILQYQGFMTILGQIGQVLKSTVGDYMEQANQIRTLSLVTGAGYEETSRLVQVFDDADVEVSMLRAAMLAMKREGLSPSIDTLAKLADEYRAISDPVARVTFLTEKFGGRGTELGKIFDLTGQQIREAGAAVAESLIFDEEKIKATEALRIAQDELNDSLLAVKNTLLGALIPGWANLIGGTKELAAAIAHAGKASRDYDAELRAVSETTQARIDQQGLTYEESIKVRDGVIAERKAYAESEAAEKKYTDSMWDAYSAMRAQSQADYSAYWDAYNKSISGVTNSVYDLAASEDALIQKQKAEQLQQQQDKLQMDIISAAIQGPLKAAYQGYTDSLIPLKTRHQEILDQLALLQAEHPKTKKAVEENKQAVADLTTELGIVEQAEKDAKTAMQETTTSILLQNAAAVLSPEAYLAFARSLGAISEEDYKFQDTMLKIQDSFDPEHPDRYTEAMLLLNDAFADGKLDADEILKIMDSLDGKISKSTLEFNIVTNGSIPNPNGTSDPTQPDGIPDTVPAAETAAQKAARLAREKAAREAAARARANQAGNERAAGGPVSANTPYIVGEKRPELFIPKTAGYIYPSITPNQSMISNNYSSNVNLGGVNISNTMDLAAFRTFILDTVQTAMRPA